MTKPKPWKPYDVEQAKAEIAGQAKKVIEQATAAIERTAAESIRQITVEAAAFKDLPRDTSSLFMDAQHVAIGEMDLRQQLYGVDAAIGGRLYQLQANFHGFGAPTSPRYDEGVQIPKGKYRVLTFFIPIED